MSTSEIAIDLFGFRGVRGSAADDETAEKVAGEETIDVAATADNGPEERAAADDDEPTKGGSCR